MTSGTTTTEPSPWARRQQPDPDAEPRFEFGENWSKFLEELDERRITAAGDSLRDLLEVDSLVGRSFLDIGSGSGLFSLAARRLGARVHSFDLDPRSVACTRRVRHLYRPGDDGWRVESGSALDDGYLGSLGQFDVVYAWGVLHHTGDLWRALDNACLPVAEGGRLFLALYNDQGNRSRRWLRVKQAYNRLPPGLRWLVWMPVLVRTSWRPAVKDLLRGRPFHYWRHYGEGTDGGGRGMSAWHDFIDWVGGLPFEVAKPGDVLRFYRARGLALERLETTYDGSGCNEYVFRRTLR